MNKLVSKNPVLRFKLGKKIIKAGKGDIIVYNGKEYEDLGNGTMVMRSGELLSPIRIPLNIILNTATRQEANALGRFNRNYPYNRYASEYEPASPQFPAIILDARFGDYIDSWDGMSGLVADLYNNYLGYLPPKVSVPYIPSNTLTEVSDNPSTDKPVSEKSQNNQKSSSPQLSFKQAFNQARNSGLKEFTWRGRRFNTLRKGEEGFVWSNENRKWINPSIKFVAPSPTDMTPEEVEELNRKAKPIITLSTILQNDFTRDKLNYYPSTTNTVSYNPNFNWKDALMEAKKLRYNTLFVKKGTKLVSKNPVLRFKSNFLVSGSVTTLKTGGNIPIYKKGSKAYAANNKYLKIANKLGLYSKDDVRAYLRKLGIKDDGVWDNDTQKAYNTKLLNEITLSVLPQQAGIITSSNSSLTYKPWRPTEKVGVVGACGTENCSEWANKSLRNYKDSKGRVLYTYDDIGGDAWTRLSAGKHAKMVYSGYDGMDYDPNNYNYNLAHLRNWQAALNLYDNFDSKTLDENKTYLVNMYYNGSPQTENAWRNGTNGTTGTHTGNLYWNPETNSWRVAHNIHNKLYDDDFIKIQGVRKGKHLYGVTAIAEAPMIDYTRKDWNEAHPIKAAINRIYDFGMWKEGGKLRKKLIPKALYGTELPEVTVTAIDVNKHAGTPLHKNFIRALNSNRNEFMKRYKLSDLEYADLSKFALNLTGAESSNGYDRNVFKRTYIYPDWLIHLGKLWRRGKDSANSRGLTQIKYDDDIKNPDLQKYYIDLGIDGIGIKYDPKLMARATLGRTLWILDLLKKQYGNLPVHYSDGTEMPQEVAQALYWNRGKVTDRANGNPETGSTVGAAKQIEYYNSRRNIK